MKGYLITFEGIDGSGKSSQAKRLLEYLNSKGIDSILLREPGGTPEGERIREILLDIGSDLPPKAELFLFLASRNILTNKIIIPSLKKGVTVIVDRYADSSMAYQGYGRQIDLRLVEVGNVEATEGIKPDLTFYLDITVEEALKRKRERDRMELDEEFLKRVRNGYLKMVESDPRFVLINAMKEEEKVWFEIKEYVDKRILKEE